MLRDWAVDVKEFNINRIIIWWKSPIGDGEQTDSERLVGPVGWSSIQLRSYIVVCNITMPFDAFLPASSANEWSPADSQLVMMPRWRMFLKVWFICCAGQLPNKDSLLPGLTMMQKYSLNGQTKDCQGRHVKIKPWNSFFKPLLRWLCSCLHQSTGMVCNFQ